MMMLEITNATATPKIPKINENEYISSDNKNININ